MRYVRCVLIGEKIRRAGRASLSAARENLADVRRAIKENGMDATAAFVANEAGRAVLNAGDKSAAIEAFDDFAEQFAQSKSKDVAKEATFFRNAAEKASPRQRVEEGNADRGVQLIPAMPIPTRREREWPAILTRRVSEGGEQAGAGRENLANASGLGKLRSLCGRTNSIVALLTITSSLKTSSASHGRTIAPHCRRLPCPVCRNGRRLHDFAALQLGPMALPKQRRAISRAGRPGRIAAHRIGPASTGTAATNGGSSRTARGGAQPETAREAQDGSKANSVDCCNCPVAGAK